MVPLTSGIIITLFGGLTLYFDNKVFFYMKPTIINLLFAAVLFFGKYFTKKLKSIIKIMSVGIILFSFSIYLINMQDLIRISISFLAIITPIGGLILITSWIMLFFSIKKQD